MMSEENPADPNMNDFENLFVNNPEFERIQAYLSKFNPIKIMRMEKMEVRHSNILAWLLDPGESHGLGDRFVKAFLAEALRGQSTEEGPNAIDLLNANFHEIEIRREWHHIDIFLYLPAKKWAFIIENKVYSKQSKGQLARYRESVDAHFKHTAEIPIKRGIFLSLLPEEPQDATYATVGYSAVSEILVQILAIEGHALGKQVRTFIEQYVEIILEEAGMSDERNKMEDLARSLYRQNKKVVDFIIQHGQATSFTSAREQVFGTKWGDGTQVQIGDAKYLSYGYGGKIFGFLPLAWYESLAKISYEWPGCERWWAKRPLICWILLSVDDSGKRTGRLRLQAEVGPLNDRNQRRALIDAIAKIANGKNSDLVAFGKTAKLDSTSFSRFLKKNTINIEDCDDIDELAKGIKTLLGKFKPVFDEVSSSLSVRNDVDGESA